MKKQNDIFCEKRTRKTFDTFTGIKSARKLCDGDISRGSEMSCEHYPAVSLAAPRRLLDEPREVASPCSIGADERIYYAAGGDFVYNGAVRGNVSIGKKHFAQLDDAIAIFPDNMYYDHRLKYYVYDPSEVTGICEIPTNESINRSCKLIAVDYRTPTRAIDGDKYYNTLDKKLYTYDNGAWSHPCTLSYDVIYSAPYDEFDYLTHRFVWVKNESETLHALSVPSQNDDELGTIKITFYRDGTLKRNNFNQFKVGDRISVTGLIVNDDSNKQAITALAAGTTIRAFGMTYITVDDVFGAKGLDADSVVDSGPVIFERIMPELACVTCSGNRLWGAMGSKIYASLPHDLTRWGEGNALNTTVTLETGVLGDIIGCADYGGLPIFFGKGEIIKVIAVYNGYKISVTPAPSLSSRSPDSIAYVNGAIYYLSDSGVMCYSGTSPKKIETPFEPTANMIGGSDGSRYYLTGSSETYIYEPAVGVWYSTPYSYSSLARFGSSIVGINGNETCSAYIIGGASNDGTPVNNSTRRLEFAPFCADSCSAKTFTRIFLRAHIATDAQVKLYASYDGGKFKELAVLYGTGRSELYETALLPMRANDITLAIEPTANSEFSLLSLTYEYVLHEDYNK